MNKLIIAALLLSVATSAQAGFKYFAPGGGYAHSKDTAEEKIKSYATGLTYQGFGRGVLNISVPPGKYTADIWHYGQRNCILVAHSIAEDEKVHLSNFIGTKYERNYAEFEGGQYALEVIADGQWQINLSLIAGQTPKGVLSYGTFIPNHEKLYNTEEKKQEVDMSGIEWRQTRGVYSGRDSKITEKFGYGPGKYKVSAVYKGDFAFTVSVQTRRGNYRQVIDEYKACTVSTVFWLEEKDEVWFEVRTRGNWEIIMERAN